MTGIGFNIDDAMKQREHSLSIAMTQSEAERSICH